jgi:FliI/YscN family ATPase
LIAIRGRVVACRSRAIDAQIPTARLGDRVRIETRRATLWAQVAEIAGTAVTLVPLGDPRDVGCGDPVVLEEAMARDVVGIPLLGRAIDGLGAPLDGGSAPRGRGREAPAAPQPLQRRVPRLPLWTGIRAVDGLLTLARGARVGIFGPPGTGKSSLLERIARNIEADAVVVALVGERGGEACRHLSSLDARTTIVCAPTDRTAAERLAAADLALAHAQHLCARGLAVAVILDSLARYGFAAREIALACGEPAGRGGFPPSVFARLAALVERAGSTDAGSITLIASILSDAGDPADPLAEAARALLDGHIVLSRPLAERGRFPAIDVPASLSRTMAAVVEAGHAQAAGSVRSALARLAETADARELGVVIEDAALDRALTAEAHLEGFLRQGEEATPAAETLRSLAELADRL